MASCTCCGCWAGDQQPAAGGYSKKGLLPFLLLGGCLALTIDHVVSSADGARVQTLPPSLALHLRWLWAHIIFIHRTYTTTVPGPYLLWRDRQVQVLCCHEAPVPRSTQILLVTITGAFVPVRFRCKCQQSAGTVGCPCPNRTGDLLCETSGEAALGCSATPCRQLSRPSSPLFLPPPFSSPSPLLPTPGFGLHGG